MKWIKLFESFDNLENKIKFVNDSYCYFKIMLEFKQMNLQKLETKDNIYFYTTSLGKKILMFVYCKKSQDKRLENTLIYSSDRKYKFLNDLVSNELDYELTLMEVIYEKVLDDFFSEYAEGLRKKTLQKIEALTYLGFKWSMFVNAFQKLKMYKS